MSEKDRATATGDMYGNLCEVWTCGFGEMQADRERDRQTDRQTDMLITILLGQNNNKARNHTQSHSMRWRKINNQT